MLLQESDSTGLAAGAFKSARVTDFVSTALAKGGTLQLAPTGALAFNGATLSFTSGAFTFSAPLSVPSLSSTGNIFVAGNALATQINVDALFDVIVENSVWTVNGRKGNVQLITDDILRAGGAPIRDAHFGGFNTSPTPWDFRANSDQIATTAFVQMVISQLLCSPTLITRSGPGVLTTADVNAAFAASVAPVWPTAPSPTFGDASDRIATTLFVDESLAELQHQIDQITATGEFAPLDSPNFTGLPTAPTANAGTATGQLATCAFVQHAIVASTTGVSSFNTRTGAVVLTAADITGAGGAPLASPVFTGVPQAPTAMLHNSSQEIATTAYVQGELAALPVAAVTSFNTRTGAVVLTTADITGAGGAPLTSPALAGAPSAPTAAPGDNSTRIATTQFVMSAVSGSTAGVSSFNTRTGAVTLIANDVSSVGGALTAGPAFSGVPTAPTATIGTNTTQLATCAFVANAISAVNVGVSSFNTRTGAVTLTLTDITGAGGAPIASPGLMGVPTAPTAAQASNDTTIATTAYVRAALAAAPGGVSSWNGRTGAVTLQGNDVSAAGGALLASPAFSGTPTSPTPLSTANANEIATASWVLARLSTLGGVSSFNGRAGAVTLTTADITGAGGAPLVSPALSGTPTAPTPAVGDNSTNVATTAFVAAAAGGGAAPLGGQLTYVSATALKFASYGGNYIRLNGVTRAIPAGGIAGLANTAVYVNGTAGQNLAASTTYLIFAFDSAGVLTADFRSGATHATSTTAGNEGTEILTGDNTRSLIGQCHTNATSQFADSPLQRHVRSWFNRQSKHMVSALTGADQLVTSVSFILTNAAICEFVLFANDIISFGLAGGAFAATAGGVVGLGLDGPTTLMGTGSWVNSSASTIPLAALAQRSDLTEGYHWVGMIANVSTGGNLTIQGTTNATYSAGTILGRIG